MKEWGGQTNHIKFFLVCISSAQSFPRVPERGMVQNSNEFFRVLPWIPWPLIFYLFVLTFYFSPCTPLQSQLLLQVMDIRATFLEGTVRHDFPLQRNIGLDAIDHDFIQGHTHACQGRLAGLTVGDQLADH